MVVTPEFKKDFGNLDNDLQAEVKEILRSLENGEEITGAFIRPLMKDLKGFTSVHFHKNSYRLIYREVKNKIKIIVLMVGPRGNEGGIYDRFRELKNKRKL